jgi:lysozyme
MCTGGKPTIGVGHIACVSMGDTCTEEQADEWLRADIIDAENAVNDLVKVPIKQSMFNVLVSFVFNLGRGNFASSTLLRLLNKGFLETVPAQLLRWIYASGKKDRGLIARRKDEGDVWVKAMSETDTPAQRAQRLLNQ